MSNTVIQTNVPALNAQRNLKVVGKLQTTSMQRLASGYRINSAADDAAGLAISEKMRSQIRGLDMASKNSLDAQSLITTAEGGLNEIDSMVQRIRELVVYAANDTNEQDDDNKTQGDRQKIQDEINQLTDEIDSISNRVEFNKKKLINGSQTNGATRLAQIAGQISQAAKQYHSASIAYKTAVSQAGGKVSASNNTNTHTTVNIAVWKNGTVATISMTFHQFMNSTSVVGLQTSTSIKGITASPGVGSAGTGYKIKTNTGTADNVGGISGGYGKTGAAKGNLSLTATKLATISKATYIDETEEVSAILNKINIFINAAKDQGTILTKDEADGLQAAKDAVELMGSAAKQAAYLKQESRTLAKSISTAQKQGNDIKQGLYFQIGANANQSLTLSINRIASDTLGIGNGGGQSLIDVREETGSDVTNYLTTLDNALTVVTTERSKLGAASNRLDYTIKSLDTSSENLSSAESRIRDTDFAKESVALAKANILQQSGITVLAQAKSNPQQVLSLLQ